MAAIPALILLFFSLPPQPVQSIPAHKTAVNAAFILILFFIRCTVIYISRVLPLPLHTMPPASSQQYNKIFDIFL